MVARLYVQQCLHATFSVAGLQNVHNNLYKLQVSFTSD